MGNSDSKLNFRKAVVQLTSKNQSIDPNDEFFWSQFWSENIANIQDIYALIPSSEIRALREEAPSNLASLCFKLVEKIKECSESTFITEKNRMSVLNCMRLLTRILPYIFEEPEWRGFFWSDSRLNRSTERDMSKTADAPLAQTLLNSLINLLFIPDFTVAPHKKNFSSEDDKIKTIDSCEYIWEAGVGFSHSPPQNYHHDYNRTEILKLLLTTFSEAIYMPPLIEYHIQPNLWITYFSSFKNQHSLPLFTSLLNIVFSYDPVGYGLPYNYLMFTDSRESLVEVSCQLLCVILETNISLRSGGDHIGVSHHNDNEDEETNEAAASSSNLFISYISRIHRDEDFNFILKGFCRLLNNPMTQTILPGSCKKIEFYQELLILFWKFCDYNKKFMYYVFKSSEMLNILVPILYFLIDSRADTSKIGLIHIGVFILLLLSGERNFGVRLNKPYISKIPMDIPIFSGSHADLLIIVFHRLITTTNHRLQPLYDCLMTIIVNISPYIKSMGMVASTKLIHLLEAFSSYPFLLSNSNNYYLVFFILEILNNIIQYQFDGNYNLVYTIIRKRNIFFNLLSLPIDQAAIDQIVDRKSSIVPSASSLGGKKSSISYPSIPTSQSSERIGSTSSGQTAKTVEYTKTMEGATPAKEAEPGTLKASLAEFPSVLNMTEKTMPSTIGAATASPDKSNTNENIDYNFMQDSFTNERSPPRGGGVGNNDALIQLKQPDVVSSTSSISSAINNEKTDHHNSSGDLNTSDLNDHDNKLNKSNGSRKTASSNGNTSSNWSPTSEWVSSWKSKLPLQTIMRLLQVLVPQVEKICVDKGLTDETEILKFLQNGTLVGLLPVPHPILIRKYQPNMGTIMWFRTYMWGVVYLRNLDPPIWYDTDVKLFEIQRV